MPINKFNTNLDLARQAEIYSGETAIFQGGIQIGIPFSGFPSGIDTGTTFSLGVFSTQDAIFSGDNVTTLFDVSNPLSPNYDSLFDPYSANTWSNPIFSAQTSGLTLPVTALSSDTQVTNIIWSLTETSIIDDNLVQIGYSGYNVTYSFNSIENISTGFTPLYSGITTAIQENFSASTLDYKGSTRWLNVRGSGVVDDRLTTNYLTIKILGSGTSESLLGVDSNGNVVSASTSTSGSTFWEETGTSNTALKDIKGGHTISGVSDNSLIGGGNGNNLNTSTNSIIIGGTNNVLSGGSDTSIIGGVNNIIDTSSQGGVFSSNYGLVDNSTNSTIISSLGTPVGKTFIENSSVSSIISSFRSNIVNNNLSNIIGSSLSTINDSTVSGTFIQNSVINSSSSNISSSSQSIIAGGSSNSIDYNLTYSASSTASGIFAGRNNLISGHTSSVIIGGEDNVLLFGPKGINSSIIGGKGNVINSTSNSVVLGGQNITGTSSDTVYVPNLNINSIPSSGDSVTNVLVRDSDGTVKIRQIPVIGVSEATSATTTTINFTGQTIYYDAVTPATGNISVNLTGSKLGLIQKIYHNDTVEPTYPSGWVLMGDAIYFTSTLNIIYAEWAGGTRVEYWYVQEQ